MIDRKENSYIKKKTTSELTVTRIPTFNPKKTSEWIETRIPTLRKNVMIERKQNSYIKKKKKQHECQKGKFPH